jgi:hypothetical protein
VIDEIGSLDHSDSSEYRIFGPPGTGKTTTLGQLIERAVAKHGPSSVLVTSFSKTAAEELTNRGLPIARQQIGTLHSHCFHALGAPKVAETDVAEWNKAHPGLAITAKSKGFMDGEAAGGDESEVPADASGNVYLGRLNRFRGMMMPRESWPSTLREFEALWTAHKREHDQMDFCDMIEAALHASTTAPGNPKVIFADESQDLNKLQLTLIRRWGRQADHFVVAADDDQCQPPGTMVRTTGGEVPIEALDPERHQLVAYAPRDGKVYGGPNRGYGFRKACSDHRWFLHTIRAQGRATRCTPEHRFFVRWVKGQALDAAHVVYLMRQGTRFRVGWCKLIRSDGIFHLGHRARLERADAAWVLKVFSDRTESSIYESYVAAKFGLPLAMFEPSNGATHYTSESLGRLFDMLRAELPMRAVACLIEHGRDPRHPLYSPERAAAKRGGSTMFVTEAANLLPGLMAVPIPNENKRVDWAALDLDTELYHGPVYSLDVEKYHSYIADGIVTHNCIYGFAGASPDAVLDPPIPASHIFVLKQSHRVPRTVHAHANAFIQQVTRRQPKEYLPRDADGSLARVKPGGFKLTDGWIIRRAMEHLEQDQSVMFLAACDYMVDPIIEKLRAHAIPFHNPYRKANGRWNPLRYGAKGSTISRLNALVCAHPAAGAQQRPWTFEDVALWTEWLISKGIMRHGAKTAVQALKLKCGKDRISEPDFAAIFEPQALQILLEAFAGGHLELLRWWQDRVGNAFTKRVAFPVEIATRHGIDAMRQPPKVVAGTIHSVKGAQADAVFLFPDLSMAGLHSYLEHGPARDSVVRQFYVGMTRAREALYLCWPETSQFAKL